MKDIAGKRVIMDNAAIEAELTDSNTGEVFGLLVDDVSKTTGKKKAKDPWDKVQKAFQFYGKRFRSRLGADR